MIKKEHILVSITTTSGSDWRAKIKETAVLGLGECALFPTCLDKNQREEFYGLLERSSIKKCPFVHLRSDMPVTEIEYLIKRFGTRVFNIHCNTENPLEYDLSKFASMIYVEHVYNIFDEAEMKQWAGVCLDISHLENDRLLNKPMFASITDALKIYRIGCNHISAMSDTIRVNSAGDRRYDRHCFEDLSQFDYITRYPAKYFSDFCALEVENSLQDQLRARDYIAGLPMCQSGN